VDKRGQTRPSNRTRKNHIELSKYSIVIIN
jgi:hypothetical protein